MTYYTYLYNAAVLFKSKVANVEHLIAELVSFENWKQKILSSLKFLTAYIAFKNEEQLALFSREYDGHLFRDKSGTCPTQDEPG